MLAQMCLRDFRCFEALRFELVPGAQFFVGPNACGKTTLLEAVCVLLRLASPRAALLRPVIREGAAAGFLVRGIYDGRQMEFRYSLARRRLVLDEDKTNATEYLRIAKLVYFGNSDVDLVRGGAEGRRRYLDFLGSQIEPLYRANLRAYERALRSRNRLLKMDPSRRREIEAYNLPLVEAGTLLTHLRRNLAAELSPPAAAAHRQISGGADEGLSLGYEPGAGDADFSTTLVASRKEETRLRQTLVGPHRDDLRLRLGGRPAADFASEGQQRTLALSLKLAQAMVIESIWRRPPLLLLDDIFGELDPERRNALLKALPAGSQRLITTTHLDWLEDPAAVPVWRLNLQRTLER